jgi:flavin reductase (DIM6/NTAB) family NADH-FMN oxidoreductase RutF
MPESVTDAVPAPAAEAAAAFDVRAFRNALGSFPTGVAVITTTGADGRPVGLTCNSFSSVSLEPPLVSWGLRINSKSLESFQRAGAFAINILAEDQTHLSGRFASSSIADKFDGVAWRPGLQGLPVLEDCVATFECVKFAEHLAGDHVLFLGEVRRFDHGRHEDSLVFYKGAYMMLAESLRKLVVEGRLGQADIDEAYRTLYGTLLRLACDRASETELDAIEAAVADIERHQPDDSLTQRIEAASRFFSAIATAGHNEALMLMAQTMGGVLRERMTHVIQVRARPELFPLRRNILRCLRRRDADAAAAALDDLITKLRAGDEAPASTWAGER